MRRSAPLAAVAAIALTFGCSSEEGAPSASSGAGGATATTTGAGGAGGATATTTDTTTGAGGGTTSTGGAGGTTSAGGAGGTTSAGGAGGTTSAGGAGGTTTSAGGAGGTTSAGGAGGAPCVDADQDGFPSAACGGTDCDDTDDAVHPGVPEPDDWKLEVVTSGSAYSDVRMTLGPTGEPHLAYFDGLGAVDLVHAVKKSGAWSFQKLTATGDAHRNPVIAVDAQDHVHIAWYTGSKNGLAGDLRYVTDASGAWVAEKVDAVGDVRNEPSIAVDAAGVVHLAYIEDTSGELRYARREKGAWTKEVVASSGASGSECQIDARDPAGPSVLYNVPYDDLRFASRGAKSWTTKSVLHVGFPGIGLSLAFDASGKRHYAHWDLQSGHLLHTHESPGWATDDLGDFGVGFSRPTSIAVRDATPFVAFPWFDPQTSAEAVYVGRVAGGAVFVEKVVEHIDDATIAAHTSLVVDAGGTLLVSSTRRVDVNSPREIVLVSRPPTDGVDPGCNGE